MQVVLPFYLSNPSIKSTIDLTDLSLLSLLLIKNFDCILSNVNDPWKVNTVGVLNYESLTKTELSHTCTINHTLIFKHDQDCLNNCPYKNGFQKSCKDFMDDGKGMSATNSKRYLQNKLGDRKRRRPDSAIIEPSEMDDSVDSSIRCRQTTRQSMQRNLMPVAISLQKSNKIDKTCLTPSGSKKHLRSSKHDTELFCDNKELTDQCDPTNNLKNSVEELLKNNNDISNTTCKRNCDNLKSNNYSIENEENNTKVDDKDCKDNAHREEHNLDKNNFEREGNNEGNAMKINNLNMKTHDQSKSNNNDSNIMSEKSNKKLCESHTASADDYPMLAYKNMNPNSGIDTTNSSYIISETLNQSFRLGVNSWENDKETQELKKTENNTNENNNFTPAHLCESDSLISLRPALGSLNNDNKNHEVYEDHLSHISNSLCSDSLSSNSCCKTANNIDSVSNNESKSDLEDPNKTNSAKLEINSSHTNLVITQPENDSVSAQEDEQCQNFNNDNNNGCSIKSESVYNITKLGVHTHDVSSNYAKTQESPKCESIQSDYKSVEHSLEAENIEYRKEVDNKQEDKSLRLYVSTEDSQIINMHKNDHNTDSGLENNLGESSAISTRKPDDKYKESQHSEKASNQQQLPKDINTADKLYTQIEEEFHHHQPDVTSLSSDYGQLINNNQQSSQEESGHDINLSHQQDPPQQHSVHQQQQYSNAHLYQLHPQDHHQQLHIQHQQMQKEIELQQHHHNISHDTQRESGPQEHSLMEFLHPQHHHSSTNIQSPLHQQQHQIHEVYHDLMMEEFHEDHHTPYKLSLSPSTVKHENQDDGYETSAGDVLTPNSHASSTHSVTPQHHLHHSTGGSGFAANISKCEEQHAQQQQPNIQLQQSQHNCNLINEQIMHQELTSNESAKHLTPRDTYHFMDDDLNSPNNNNNLRNILTPPHSHSRAVNQEVGTMNHFLSMQSDVHSNMLNSASDIYGLTSSTVNRHLTEKQNVIEPISTTTVTNTNHQQHFLVTGSVMPSHDQDSVLNIQTKSLQKKRGRKKKIPQDGILPTLERTSLNELSTGYIKAKERKKHDRFNGMSEEEIVKRSLPDHLCENLDIVIIGINPGLFAAYKGHHYAGPGNHFWKCLYLSGLTQEQMSADEDFKLIKCGIGFTNMVQRATKGSADLTRKEIKEGSRILLEKLQRFRPKIAVFNGKLIFEVFSGRKDFNFGKQPECVEGTDTFIWVMPSSSARCAQLPRAADKVPFYAALKKFRDYLNGLIPHIDQSECVFTDERIKQQCEEQNFKNQQNNISGETSDTFSNNVGICNSDKLLQSNTFDSESNPHGAGGGPGPPQSSTGDSTGNTSFMMSSLVGTHQEKKKRGRPKKIKEQELIDPLTGNKIQVNTQILTPGSGEYSNILNLSVAQVPNEMPKKKRGRPKKVKLPTNALQGEVESSPILSQKSNIFSIHSMTTDVIQSSPHHMQGIKQSHQHASIYSTPPSQHQQNIYSPMVSPMASPSLNCSYTTNTPPSQPNQEKMVLPANERESSKTTSEVLVTSQNSLSEQNFCESPRPNSPNICAVDFNPPAASTANSLLGNNVNSNINTMHHQRLQSIQKPRFNSPGNGEATPDHNTNSEPFQQWLSPQHNNHGVQSPAAATIVSNTVFSNSSQQTPLNYHEQQQVQALQQQDIHAQWPLRHQSRYDDGPYLLTSSVHQTQPHRHESHHHQQQNHSGSDVARKSLSGLESLVDQIPSISESETIALSSAAAVNVQVAAAAAVENRLQSMQNSSHNDSQVGDDSHFPTITRSSNLLTANSNPTSAALSNNQMQQSASLLNTNFSVSNLAASSAPNNNQENYGISSNSRSLTNSNAYHHSNLMAAAVLAAAAASSPSHLSTPSSAPSTAAHHAQMYMDPHSHLTTHVPINSIYPATATSHHHHSAVAAHHHHHSAAVHYNTGPHSATDYTTNNLYPSSQSNAATGHTLHMPSPNYPYGYSTASSQSNYSAYPHTHANHHHGHPHAHHTAHHLGMFDRLKPSDITGYSGGF